MIIDFHTHTFPDKIAASAIKMLSEKAHMAPSVDGTEGGLLMSMKNAGVDYCVTFSVATKPSQVPKLNDLTIALSDSRDGLIRFGAMHPDFSDYEAELERLKAGGVKGIKIHPVYQDVHLSDSRYINICRKSSELGLIVLSHGGLDVGYPGVDFCGPKEARTLMDKVDGLKFVMAHMGGWRQWDDAVKYLKDTPVYIDTSFSLGSMNPLAGQESYYTDKERQLMSLDEFADMVKNMGADCILFGTDSPWMDQGVIISIIKSLPLKDSDIEKILGQNAVKVLGL